MGGEAPLHHTQCRHFCPFSTHPHHQIMLPLMQMKHGRTMLWMGRQKETERGGGKEGSFGRNTTSDGEGRMGLYLSHCLHRARKCCVQNGEKGVVLLLPPSFCLLRRPRLLKAPFLFFSLLLGSLRSTFPTFPPSSVWPYFPPSLHPFFRTEGASWDGRGRGCCFSACA